MDTFVRRAMVTLIPPALVGAGSVAVLVAAAPRLPDQAYGTGLAGGVITWPTVIALAVLWALGNVVIAAGMLHLRRAVPTAQRWVAPEAWLIAAVGGGVVVQLVLRNLDLDGPPARPDLWWTAAPVAVPTLLVLAVVAWWAMGPGPQFPPAAAGPGPQAPRLQLAEGERAIWTRSVVSRRAVVSACLFGALAVGNAFSDVARYLPEMTFGCLTVMTAVQSWVRVHVDQRGVRVIQPLLGRTLVGVALRDVVEARADTEDTWQVPPWAYGVVDTAGTFGYRARGRGEVLRLTTAAERDFVVTAPDADTAAALVNTELDRRRTGADGLRC